MRNAIDRPGLSTLDMLIAYAVEAPSSHNSQPWRFAIDGPSRVRVFADRARQLTVGDPAGRELVISCGAAIENLVVAARAFGFDAEVVTADDPREPDLLATVTLAPGDWPTDEESLLFDAIEARHTVRDPFARDPVGGAIVGALAAAATDRGAALVSVESAATRAICRALVEEGDRRLFASAAWRRELADWVQRSRHAGDGLRFGRAPAPLARMAIRAIDLGGRLARLDGALVEQAPVLGILVTAGDTRRDWLRAGRALERVLLTAARHGVQAGFLNQPCQIPELRAQVRALVLDVGEPQIVLRLGRVARAERPTPRRDLADVVHAESC